LPRYFRDLEHPRQPGKLIYPLDEILLLCLLAEPAVAETTVDIGLFGRNKCDLLRRLLRSEAGTPAHHHLGYILATLDAERFQRCFTAGVAALTGLPETVVATDGKTSHRSRGEQEAVIHTVSALAAR
jgi:DDE_Tnp_1-associated